MDDSRMIAALHLSVYRCARAALLASRLLRRRLRQPCRPRAVRFPCFRFLRATVCGCCLRLRSVPLPCPSRSCLHVGHKSRPPKVRRGYGSRLCRYHDAMSLSRSSDCRKSAFVLLPVRPSPSFGRVADVVFHRYSFFLCTTAEKRERSLVLNIISIVARHRSCYSCKMIIIFNTAISYRPAPYGRQRG